MSDDIIICGNRNGPGTRILFLDDMAWRHSEFAKALFKRGVERVEVHRAWTAAEAKEYLHMYEFDQVFLDHDLCEEDIMLEVGERGKEASGMDVVDHIVAMENPPKDIIVHSLNGPARFEMCRRLEERGGIRVRNLPFHDLLRLLCPAMDY